MLKKINVDQLTLGMHITDFCGAWMDHPFWRTDFVLTEPKDLDMIRKGVIRELWIDISQGLDTPPVEHPQDSPTPKAQPQITRAEFLKNQRNRTPTSLSSEVERAAKICAKAKNAVTSMFQEARMGKAIQPSEARKLTEEITDSVTRNPQALISLARLKTADDYTYMHSVAVCALMIALAKQLNLSEEDIQSAGIAGLMHDLGKALTPTEILNKPGKLTDEEFAIIKKHPELGAGLIKEKDLSPTLIDVILHHHEKVDGSGYPHGLKGEKISLFAKMGAVCDVYDAITSNRPYKAGWDPAESIRRMAEWSNTHFDDRIFQAFVKSLGIYPVGSLIRLSSGRIALVIAQSTSSLLKPTVKAFFSTRTQERIIPDIIDLSRTGCPERIIAREDPAQWHFPDLNELWMSAQSR